MELPRKTIKECPPSVASKTTINNRIYPLISTSIILLLISCVGRQEESSHNRPTTGEGVRLKQYYAQGAKLYTTYCVACHQQDGAGLASLYPPLAGSDYLLEDIARAACIIRNGQFEEIVVNGVSYHQMMPSLPISDIEIAEVLTYITNTWGNRSGLVEVKEVEEWIDECE